MAISVPIVGQEITVADFGAPVANAINNMGSLIHASKPTLVSGALSQTRKVVMTVSFNAVAGHAYATYQQCGVVATAGTLVGATLWSNASRGTGFEPGASSPLTSPVDWGCSVSQLSYWCKGMGNALVGGSNTITFQLSCAVTNISVPAGTGIFVVIDLGIDPT